MNYSANKTTTIILTISLSMLLMLAVYSMYNTSSLSHSSATEYPTVIVDSVAPKKVVGVVVESFYQLTRRNQQSYHKRLEMLLPLHIYSQNLRQKTWIR